jgi:hypothetical protein
MIRLAHTGTLCARSLRIAGVEERDLDEGAAAAHPDLVEDVREMLLDCVLGDVERRGDLLR